MTALAFQTALARLIVEPDFRDAVRGEGASALPGSLTALEASRLVTIAHDRGLDMNRTLHKGFRLGKAESGNSTPHLFDDCNLVSAHFCQDHVKRGLFLGCWNRCSGRCPGRSRRNCYWRGGADTPFFLKLLDQSSNLQNREVAELLHYFICICHFVFPPVAASESLRRIKAGSHQLGQFRLCWICSIGKMPPVQNSRRRRTLLFGFRVQQSR